MSQRQIQRLFEADETTFSQFVSVSRLQAAHSALIDRLQIHRSISDIALESGFGDISSFNRAFRNHFGAAPGAIRKTAILEVLSAN
jgi:transcriptional regulator GlxA family with amidase domain